MNQDITIQQIREAEASNKQRTANFRALPTARIDEVINLLLACAEVAYKRYSADVDAPFMFAFLGLSSKIISNANSGVQLIGLGRYGDALALVRVMMSSANTLEFLAAYEEHVNDWVDYNDLRSPGQQNDEKRKRIYRIFEEKNVRKMLDAKGIESMATSFRDLSEGVHSSLWGLRFYAKRHYTRPPRYDITFLPAYDPAHATVATIMILNLLTIPINIFLDRYIAIAGSTPECQSLIQRWNPLVEDVKIRSKFLTAKLFDVVRELEEKSPG